MSKEKIDTRAIGLDVGLEFVRWLTGAENLHYGLWDGLDVTAANLRAAQEAYTAKLFKLLPDAPCRILDIGGGAGETAKKLIALGHEVVIVVPSPLLADRCRQNAPGADVHECMFEDYSGEGGFDLCLFSESYQYIPLEAGVPRCLDLLKPDGKIILSDCFRSEAFSMAPGTSTVGGGHPIQDFRHCLAQWPVEVLSEEGLSIIEQNAETVLEEIGIEFRDDPEALQMWRDAGPVARGKSSAGSAAVQTFPQKLARLEEWHMLFCDLNSITGAWVTPDTRVPLFDRKRAETTKLDPVATRQGIDDFCEHSRYDLFNVALV